MSKNVIVEGETFNGVSFVQLDLVDGGKALFKDIDEISSGTSGILEMAVGTFTVEGIGFHSPVINHGMSVKPDVAVAFPVHWHDTVDKQIALAACSQIAYAAVGRREIAASSCFPAGNMVTTDTIKITDTTIRFTSGAHANFHPTYTTADGETGQQVYKWVAIKFKE